MRVSLETHREALADLVHSVRCLALPSADRDDLVPLWQSWVQEATDTIGQLPPGNASADQRKLWQRRHAPKPKSELRLTPGKGADKLTVTMEELIAGAVSAYKASVNPTVPE